MNFHGQRSTQYLLGALASPEQLDVNIVAFSADDTYDTEQDGLMLRKSLIYLAYLAVVLLLGSVSVLIERALAPALGLGPTHDLNIAVRISLAVASLLGAVLLTVVTLLILGALTLGLLRTMGFLHVLPSGSAEEVLSEDAPGSLTSEEEDLASGHIETSWLSLEFPTRKDINKLRRRQHRGRLR